MKINEETNELEKLIDNSSNNLTKNVPDSDFPAEIAPDPTMDVDFAELKEKCDIEAKTMILNAISFSLPADMIEGNEYINNKIEVDTMSLSGMVYQLRCNEAVQKAIMEEIKKGAVHPRNFEVFAGMSKTIGELNKQLLQTVEAIRVTYRSIKQDIHEKRTEALGPTTEGPRGLKNTGDGGIVAYGSKDLIKKAKEQKHISDTNIVPPEVSD
jgi:hypothetical protein